MGLQIEANFILIEKSQWTKIFGKIIKAYVNLKMFELKNFKLNNLVICAIYRDKLVCFRTCKDLPVLQFLYPTHSYF